MMKLNLFTHPKVYSFFIANFYKIELIIKKRGIYFGLNISRIVPLVIWLAKLKDQLKDKLKIISIILHSSISNCLAKSMRSLTFSINWTVFKLPNSLKRKYWKIFELFFFGAIYHLTCQNRSYPSLTSIESLFLVWGLAVGNQSIIISKKKHCLPSPRDQEDSKNIESYFSKKCKFFSYILAIDL